MELRAGASIGESKAKRKRRSASVQARRGLQVPLGSTDAPFRASNRALGVFPF